MSSTRTIPAPVLDHLISLSDGNGLFEHARHDVPRPEHGYCIDDEARAVVVLCREDSLDPAALALLGRVLSRITLANGGRVAKIARLARCDFKRRLDEVACLARCAGAADSAEDVGLPAGVKARGKTVARIDVSGAAALCRRGG